MDKMLNFTSLIVFYAMLSVPIVLEILIPKNDLL